MKTARTLLLAVLLVLTGCAGSESTAATDPVELSDLALPTGPTDVVLRMTTLANFPDPLPIVSQFPEFTLYGDGRVILEDRERRGETIPGLVEARVSPLGMQQLVAEAAARGALDPLDDYGVTGAADANSTRFVIDTGEVEVSFSVYDLGRDGGSELTDDQIEGRGELAKLRDTLREFESLVDSEVISGRQALAADAVAIVGRSGGAEPALELPFDLESSGVEVETRVTPVSCLIVTGDDLGALTDALSTVQPSVNTPAQMGDQVWTLAFRPLLPDETDCAQLGTQ